MPEDRYKRFGFIVNRRNFLVWCSASVVSNKGCAAMGAELSDLAYILADEFEAWHRSLAEKGIIPRAFTGVTATNKQAVVILDGLALDHFQRRHFLIWLCRTEKFIAYAYSTRVAIADEDQQFSEALDIYASSINLDVTKTLLIKRRADGGIDLAKQFSQSRLPASDDKSSMLFFGLQRSHEAIVDQEEQVFLSLWQEIRPKAMWRNR